MIFVLVSVLLIFGCKSEKHSGYKITGNISDLNNSMVYLKKLSNDGYKVVDSVISKNSEFTFVGKIELPELYKIQCKLLDLEFPVFIENSDILIKLDSANNGMDIQGSVSHNLLKALWRSLDSIDALQIETKLYYEKAQKACDAKKMTRLPSLDSLEDAPTNCMVDFVKRNNKSTVAVFVLYKYLSGSIDLAEIEKLRDSFDKAIESSIYFDLLNKDIKRNPQIGQQAKDFVMTDVAGDSIQLSKLYANYLLLDFWASWCPSCREENPELVVVYNDFNKKGLQILGVSFDKDHEKWVKAIEKDKLSWKHVSDLKGWNNAAGEIYGIRSIPSNILIDKNGVIVAKNLSSRKLRAKLSQLGL